MKIKDYWRLAKISLKARKKATRSTVRGMSISLIIIVPVVFAIIALYASILPQLNENPETLYAIFQSGQKGISVNINEDSHFNSIGNSAGYYERSFLTDRTEALKALDKNLLHYTLLHNYKSMRTDSDNKLYQRFVLDGENKPLRYEDNNTNYYGSNTRLAVVDTNHLNLLEKSKFGVLGDEYNKGFSGTGARQVMLNRGFLKLAGLTEQDVYEKNISLYIREYSTEMQLIADGTETQFVDHYLFRDFKVVGVFGNKNRTVMWRSQDINDCDIIVSGASYYNKDGTPVIANSVEKKDNGNYSRYYCDFGNVKDKNEQAYNYIFTGGLAYGAYSYMTEGSTDSALITVEKNCYKYMPDRNSINPYGELSSAMSEMYPHYKDLYGSKLEYNIGEVGSPSYQSFALINMILTIAMSIIGVFAGIILFAALVNLFNTIMHSVNSRKNYLGVMRAIGARSSVIPKLYLFEVLRVFTRAFVWILVVGGGICVGIKFLFDYLFSGGVNAMGLVISISWGMIPVALVAVGALLAIIGVIYSVGCSWKLSRKPIMEILEG